MTQIKTFSENSTYKLDEAVNEWLQKNQANVIVDKIEHSSAISNMNLFSVMIVYRSLKRMKL